MGAIGCFSTVMKCSRAICVRAFEIALCDHCEVERGAEAEFADREYAMVGSETFGEALRFDEHAHHFGDTVGRVIDVAEAARERLVALPTQLRRNQYDSPGVEFASVTVRPDARDRGSTR